MRLIDADRLSDEITRVAKDNYMMMEDIYYRALTLTEALEVVEESPTVDPVRRGKWRGAYDGFLQCSCCRMVGAKDPYRFCPDCGAKMEE